MSLRNRGYNNKYNSLNHQNMRRTATTLLLLLTTLWASAQIKQTYLPDFKKGQTATYEYICTKTHRRNCDNVTVDGLELTICILEGSFFSNGYFRNDSYRRQYFE